MHHGLMVTPDNLIIQQTVLIIIENIIDSVWTYILVRGAPLGTEFGADFDGVRILFGLVIPAQASTQLPTQMDAAVSSARIMHQKAKQCFPYKQVSGVQTN
jgi:hypothetical protein